MKRFIWILLFLLITTTVHAYQASINIPNGTGSQVRSGMNNALQAVTTHQSGASAPATTYPFMAWMDTSSLPATLKIRNMANNGWITLGTFNDTGSVFTASRSAVSNDAISHSNDVAGGVHGAVTTNTANMIVRRNSSGGFSAGTITATGFSGPLTGNSTGTHTGPVIGDVTGNLTSTGVNSVGVLNESKGQDIPAAATIDLGAATGNYVRVTGTTNITSLGTAAAGIRRTVEFTGQLTLTHSANLDMPGARDWVTLVGDKVTFISDGAGVWKCVHYQRYSGTFVYNTVSFLTVGTSSWTVPPNILPPLYITAQGGGGNGGARTYIAGNCNTYVSGGGGGAGALIYKAPMFVEPNQVLSIVVGGAVAVSKVTNTNTSLVYTADNGNSGSSLGGGAYGGYTSPIQSAAFTVVGGIGGSTTYTSGFDEIGYPWCTVVTNNGGNSRLFNGGVTCTGCGSGGGASNYASGGNGGNGGAAGSGVANSGAGGGGMGAAGGSVGIGGSGRVILEYITY